MTVKLGNSRKNREYIVGQDGRIQEGDIQVPVEANSIYVKLDSYNDESGEILEFFSNLNFEDTSGTVTFKEDYGDIGKNRYFANETTYFLPPWLKISEEPNQTIKTAKFIDKIKPLYTGLWFAKLMALKDIENIDTSNTIDMNNMFLGCSNLTDLDLSNFDTSNVTDMSGMFNECSSLMELDLSSFDTRKVTDMGFMFGICYKLKTIYIGENWSTSQANTADRYWGINSSNINFIKK